MEQSEQEVTKLSKINSASLINLRIHNLWLNVNRFASAGMYSKWNTELDRIWCELVGDIAERKKKKEKKEGEEKERTTEEQFSDFDTEISEKIKELKPKTGFDTYNKEDKTKMGEMYKAIQKKEIFLRRLMNKQGKGTAYEEGWDEYIKG